MSTNNTAPGTVAFPGAVTTPGITSRSQPLIGRVTGLLFLAQFVLLAVAGAQSIGSLNPDGISYMRIAMYYTSGRFDLAINGYWGPMISWIMVPALWAGLSALVAFRIACGLSAVIFLAGSLRVFGAVGLDPRDTVVASCIVMLFTVYWPVTAVSPDLLVNGLLLCGLADLLTVEPTGAGAHPLRAGFFFGVSYLVLAAARIRA